MSSHPLAIRLSEVSKIFPGMNDPAVSLLNLEVREGELVAFVGPSGCGKTTTLRIINRLVEPTSGNVEVFGEDQQAFRAHELRRKIGYVIQQVGLFPHRTIAQNIGTVPRLLGWKKKRILERTAELTELIGLEPDVLSRYPSELSGGQQQRVGVARALAADPPILLMDEPYSAVDPIVRSYLQDELLELQQKVEKTIVIVTHDIDEAIKLGDRVAVFGEGGVLEQYATPKELLQRPESQFVEEFLGEDRGIRQLGLFQVADLNLDGLKRWPTLRSGVSVEEAGRVIQQSTSGFAVVVDEERALGWVGLDCLADGRAGTSKVEPKPFQFSVQPETSLRTALDGIVRSKSRSALVTDNDGRYLGLVTVEEVSAGLEDSAG